MFSVRTFLCSPQRWLLQEHFNTYKQGKLDIDGERSHACKGSKYCCSEAGREPFIIHE